MKKTIFYKSRPHYRQKDDRFTWYDIQKMLKDNNIELQNDDILINHIADEYDNGDHFCEALNEFYILR